MSIGKNIRKARKRAGISQAELGRRLGWGRQAVNNLEMDRDNKSPTVRRLRTVAAALNAALKRGGCKRGCTVQDLIG